MHQVDGLLVPIGFGSRGTDGKIRAMRYARENRVPFFGICLGMQCMVIEFARNVCGIAEANSSEFDPETSHAVIYKLRDLLGVEEMGGTMRLGAYPCRLREGTLARRIYGSEEISERHRHRYEVNQKYLKPLVDNGLVVSGMSPDGKFVEMVELPDHPWYLGCQFHPEYKSKPTEPHPAVRLLYPRRPRTAAERARRRRGGGRGGGRRRRMSPPVVELAAGIRTGPGALPIVAGPCVIESAEQTLAAGRAVAAIGRALGTPIIFKASYDKANRSALGSFRGPGLERGLEVAGGGRRRDRDAAADRRARARAVRGRRPRSATVLQIPAFLCRQTDLILAAAATGRAVNIKKGQFMAPGDMRRAVEKARSTGNDRITVTERGVTFGYRNLVVDMRSFDLMHDDGIAVIYDVTHSLQLPGAAGDQTGGDRRFAEPLARAAVAAGADGVYLEVHPDPERALSDSATQLDPGRAEALLGELLELRRLVSPPVAAAP